MFPPSAMEKTSHALSPGSGLGTNMEHQRRRNKFTDSTCCVVKRVGGCEELGTGQVSNVLPTWPVLSSLHPQQVSVNLLRRHFYFSGDKDTSVISLEGKRPPFYIVGSVCMPFRFQDCRNCQFAMPSKSQPSLNSNFQIGDVLARGAACSETPGGIGFLLSKTPGQAKAINHDSATAWLDRGHGFFLCRAYGIRRAL